MSAPPSPKATLAITRELQRLLGLDIDLADLPQRAERWSRNLDELAAEQGLEAHLASIQDPSDAQQTAGDDLADEILEFLRRRTT